MTDNEIKEAVERITEVMPYLNGDAYQSHLKTLLSLASDYLAAGEGLPKEKEIDWAAGRTIHPTSVDFLVGYNQALKECKLALMKLGKEE